ncbi:hypothetical protein ADICYQ_0148 [Cyclobacterium qasimii M12-11B]|nr:hypothetical protein ADICYQ_0148 [Cyclobacterium qasimii M12-11B]
MYPEPKSQLGLAKIFTQKKLSMIRDGVISDGVIGDVVKGEGRKFLVINFKSTYFF